MCWSEASDSMMLVGQAGAESAFSILSWGLAGLNLIHDVGYLGDHERGELERLRKEGEEVLNRSQ